MADYEALPAAAPQPPPARRQQPDEWFYVDTQGTEQGPFPLKSMRQWYAAGYFPKEQRILAKQGDDSEWEPLEGLLPITSPEPPAAARAPEPQPEPEPEPKAPTSRGTIAAGRRAGKPASKDVHKLFDRATPAGAALYALYNAEENESRTAGNAFSRRNAAVIEKQRRRRAALPPSPEAPKEVLPGSYEARKVRVPRVGRRRQPLAQIGGGGPARPSRKPAALIQGELLQCRDAIVSEQQLDAQRVAVKTVDREAEKRKLAKAHEMHGMDAKAMKAQLRAQQRQHNEVRMDVEPEDDFTRIMAEIDERHKFLAEMKKLGRAATYEATIKSEISDRLGRLKLIDKERSRAAAAVQ